VRIRDGPAAVTSAGWKRREPLSVARKHCAASAAWEGRRKSGGVRRRPQLPEVRTWW